MKLIRPRLELTFPHGTAVHGDEQTVDWSHITRNSITISKQYLNDLRPATSTCTLSLEPTSSVIEDIISSDGDIKALLKDGESVVFTGYLSPGWSWSVSEHGMNRLNITIEDIGKRLLSKAFINAGRHLFRCKAKAVVEAVCSNADIAVGDISRCPNPDVVKVVETGTTGEAILSQLLYELGCVYYFDNLGRLSIAAIPTDGIPLAIVDDSNIIGKVTLQKKLRQHHGVRARYKELDEASDYLIYRNTTGKDDTHPYCRLELKAGEHFDGTDIWSETDWSESTWREDALIGACNASSEMDKVGSGTIVAVNSATLLCVTSGGSISRKISSPGGPFFSMELHNASNVSATITQLDVSADIIYSKSESVVRTGDTTNVLEEEISYIHSLDDIRAHANLVDQYNLHSGSSYSFRTRASVSPCTIARLHEDKLSGLDVCVLITSVQEKDGNDWVSCTAVGTSEFSLDDDVFSRKTSSGSAATVGLKGDKGASAYEVAVGQGFEGNMDEWLRSLIGEDGRSISVNIISSNGSTFRMSEIDTVLQCQVLCNGEDITDSLDDSAFRWIRNTGNTAEDERWNTSSKALFHKTLSVTPADCMGRTVFACEVEID